MDNFATASMQETIRSVQAVVARPKQVEEAMEICSHARHGRLCVVDITGLHHEDAQRIADFLGGVCQGIGGTTERISSGIFLIVPPSHRLLRDSDNLAGYYDEILRRASSDR